MAAKAGNPVRRYSPGMIMPPSAPHDIRTQLADEGRRIRPDILSRRSDILVRLFDFLLQKSIEGQPPKEAEIASAILDCAPADGNGATVRVNVHRLRKKLDQIYSDRPGPRLQIPRGEYCIVFADPESDVMDSASPNFLFKAAKKLKSRSVMMTIGIVALANLGIASFYVARNDWSQKTLIKNYLWQPIKDNKHPEIVVVGDYYLFAEMTADGSIARLIQEPTIRSREDLDVHLMRNPEERGRYSDRALHHVPFGAVLALRDILSVAQSQSFDDSVSGSLVLASQVTPTIVKSNDIIYIGPFNALGTLLRNPIFHASGFAVGSTYDELIDKKSGRRFRSDGAVLTDNQIPRRDYGYIASLPGPSGNHILYISGMRDPAVMQMAELSDDPNKIAKLRKIGAAADGAFEALFLVRTLGNTPLSSELILARPLHTKGIWDQPGASQNFPNEIYENNRSE